MFFFLLFLHSCRIPYLHHFVMSHAISVLLIVYVKTNEPERFKSIFRATLDRITDTTFAQLFQRYAIYVNVKHWQNHALTDIQVHDTKDLWV